MRPITLVFVIGYVTPGTAAEDLLKIWRAILTDVQFWIPAVVLALGVGLLVFIHGN